MRLTPPWSIRWNTPCARRRAYWASARSGCAGSGTICVPNARSSSAPPPVRSRHTRSRSTPSTTCCTRCHAWPPRWCTPTRKPRQVMTTTPSWPPIGDPMRLACQPGTWGGRDLTWCGRPEIPAPTWSAPWMSVLAPCTLGEDQPHAYPSEGKARYAAADQIGPPLLVLHAVLKQLGSDLDHDIEVAYIQLRLLSEPDLYVTRSRRPDPGFLRAVDRFGNSIWQNLSQAMKNLLAHRPVVGHINQRHASSLAEQMGSVRCNPQTATSAELAGFLFISLVRRFGRTFVVLYALSVGLFT